MTKEEVDSLSASQIVSLMPLLEFINDIPDKLDVKREVKVGSESWKKFEIARQKTKREKQYYIAFDICEVYFGDEIWSWSLSLIYGQCLQILDSMSVFLERYKDLNNDKGYSEDEIDAGVEELETFGVGAIRHGLANGDITKFEAIENMDAETVYFTLLYNKAVANYNERYKEVLDRQKNVNT